MPCSFVNVIPSGVRIETRVPIYVRGEFTIHRYCSLLFNVSCYEPHQYSCRFRQPSNSATVCASHLLQWREIRRHSAPRFSKLHLHSFYRVRERDLVATLFIRVKISVFGAEFGSIAKISGRVSCSSERPVSRILGIRSPLPLYPYRLNFCI